MQKNRVFDFYEKLQERQNKNILRSLKTTQGLVDFASNDYLGLARSQKLKKAFFQELEKAPSPLNGLGSTGSRLLTGNQSYTQELENHIAHFHGFEKGVIFSCGYLANLALLSAIGTEKDVFLYDIEIHASMHDGMRLGRSPSFPFRHNDLDHLEKRLQRCRPPGAVFVLIESLYSMQGDFAPLQEIAKLCQEYGAHLIVDEAHAVGIFGKEGKGLVDHCGLQESVFAQVVTFGKALGVHGAIILGHQLLFDYLINYAKPYIYTTALPFHNLAAIKSSYALFPSMDEERKNLETLMNSLAKSPIYPIKIAGTHLLKKASQDLQEKGFDVRPICSPTVRKSEQCLRVCLHAFNTIDELSQVLDLTQESLCERSS